MKYKFPCLKEEIDTKNNKKYYPGSIDFKGKDVSLLLKFENKKIDEAELERIELFLNQLEETDTKNLSIFKESFDKKQKVYEYLDDFIFVREKKCKPKDLFDDLQLDRVAISPNLKKSGEYVCFDYMISSDYDNLLVLKMDKEGNVLSLTVES